MKTAVLRQGGLAESLYFEQPCGNDRRRLGDKCDNLHGGTTGRTAPAQDGQYEMSENAGNNRGIFNGGDDLQGLPH
jgi:hypothetical protein